MGIYVLLSIQFNSNLFTTNAKHKYNNSRKLKAIQFICDGMTKSEQSLHKHAATRNNDENRREFVGKGMDTHMYKGQIIVLNYYTHTRTGST